MRCIRRPIVTDVVEWCGDNLKEVIVFTGLHPSAEKWDWVEYEEVVKKDGLKLFTSRGKIDVGVGNYITKEDDGEIYSWHPEIFKRTFNILEEQDD